MKKWVLLSAVILGLYFSDGVLGSSLTITSVGQYNFTSSYGLSGLTYQGGNQWFAADDSGGKMYPLTIVLNNNTGAITSATVGVGVTLNGRTDMEGIAYNPATNTVYVSDETGPAIAEYGLSGGAAVGMVSLPSVYNNLRANYSLESLALQNGGENSLWTANEEALMVDGPLSTDTTGTWVRIQKFNTSLQPVGQWAYKTDPIAGMTPATDLERSGVSDICVLPNGKLLVLERELGGYIPAFWNRIYLVDFMNATDTSSFSYLAGSAFTGVSKQLLWEGVFDQTNPANFEGLALGPMLSNDDYSLLMVSDGDGGLNSGLYALRISGQIPEPFTGAFLLLGTFLWKNGIFSHNRR
jgi:hypothetical protein